MVTDKWLTLVELSDYLKLSLTKLYKMARDGDIPGSKIGVQWRFDRDEIDSWMKAQKFRPADSLSRKSDDRKGSEK